MIRFARYQILFFFSHVALLCRLFRNGNSKIKRTSLVVIRNNSLKSWIGNVILNSEDFCQTCYAILESGDAQEMLLILQTLLSIASKSEQLKSKMKNSPLNRKLKDLLSIMQTQSQLNQENLKILHFANMLNQLLYPQE